MDASGTGRVEPHARTQGTCGDDALDELQVDDDGAVAAEDGGRRAGRQRVQQPQVARLRMLKAHIGVSSMDRLACTERLSACRQ